MSAEAGTAGRLRWYASRIRAMSAAEMLFRMGQLSRRAGEWVRWAAGWRTNPASLLGGSPSAVASLLLSADERTFLPLVKGPPGAPRAIPAAAAGTVREAERLLAGEWVLFGRPVAVGEIPDWHWDPVTGRRWKRSFYAFVDHRGGGAKYVWELSRHQATCTLARAHRWTGDRRHADRAVALLRSWIRDNPPCEGIHWASPFECALRLLSWSFIFHATRRSGAWDADAVGDLLVSLAAQAQFIEAHPSRFSSANNHRVAEVAGLACLGLAFPELRDAERWRRTAVAELERELLLQIRPDGTGAEQAPYYLACLLDYGLVIHALAVARGGALSAACRERLVAGARFLERLSAGVTEVPPLGDADDGRGVSLDAQDVSVYDAARIGAAALLDAPELKRAGDPILERVHWLCGDAGAAAFGAMVPGAPEPSSECFADGGTVIVVAAGRGERAILDQGPLGYLSIAAHGHADALAVTIDVDGDPVFADAGTFAYHEAPRWRRYFRGTRSHCTVCVAGTEQSEHLGDTLWGRKAIATPEYRCLTGLVQCVLARHNGYSVLAKPVVHRRALLSVASDYWLVVDWLLGRAAPAAEVLWHLHSTTTVRSGDGHRWRVRTRRGAERDVVMRSTVPMDARVAAGEEAPPLGWASARYGERHPVPVLVASLAAGRPWVVATVLGRDVRRVEVEEVIGGVAVRVELPDAADDALFPLPGTNSMTASDLSLDGVAALVRRERSGAVQGVAAFGASAVRAGPVALYTAAGSAPADGAHGVFRPHPPTR